ncbi:uncharacterized protein LOC114726176 [Neltuma alba]|uniref:uncharacterized protein LOC114726176 n=1 Tax=Neltuma alba TaxID=207710 RepID=UPI0010A2EA57|nr:uncharacterized protein LOC114726176 [Prosopis alba]
MIWNSRGTGAKSFPSLIKDLKKHFVLDFLALVETRSDKQKTEKRIGGIGFHDYTFIEAEGYSEGIWCLWNAGVRKVEVIERHRQFLHLYLETSRLERYFFTVIYANPHVMNRRSLWGELHRIDSAMHDPWIIGGDFNATLFSSERHTVAPNGCSVDRDFCNWYESSSLTDIGFVGPYFTWKRGSTEALLDRYLANEAWCRLFPNARVSHLPFYKSDHRPILLQLKQHDDHPCRPFRFLAPWVLHGDFHKFVQDNWQEDVEWNHNMRQFAQACSSWNKQKELEEIISQEALIWAQKARVKWSVYGDRNTKLFHARANRRRKTNRVDALRLEGDWCYDLEVIKHEATAYFATLFTEDSPHRAVLPCAVSYPVIDETILRACGRDVDEQEVKEALFSMGPLKSPGPDGFNALFFQTQWSITRKSLVSYVKYLFSNPTDIKTINGTFVVLIPKKDPPEVLKDLRPISLCNVVYKVITKIVSNRLKVILPRIISPNQCGFVPGQLGSDNIIVAQEVIHSMRTMRGRKEWLLRLILRRLMIE